MTSYITLGLVILARWNIAPDQEEAFDKTYDCTCPFIKDVDVFESIDYDWFVWT